jgi:hypothetical protein
MGERRQGAGDWVGRRVESLKEEGIELAEEEYPDPYGEGTVQQGSPTFYGYDSIAEDRG